MRRGREARAVPEHAQAPAAVPRLAKLLDDSLERRRDRLILGVAVGNERVVDDRHASSPIVDPAPIIGRDRARAMPPPRFWEGPHNGCAERALSPSLPAGVPLVLPKVNENRRVLF